MKRLFIFLFCLSATVLAFGQATIVTGKVTDIETGDELIGVTVKVQGASATAVTDIDGKFRISAKSGQTLQFSYVGYKDATQKVSSADMRLLSLATVMRNVLP